MRFEFPPANFLVSIGKSSAGNTYPQIRVLAQQMAKSHLRIEISGRNCESQGKVRLAQKIRLVTVIICVAGKRRVTLHRHVVANLQQIALDRIDLTKGRQRAQAAQKNATPSPGTRHAGTS